MEQWQFAYWEEVEEVLKLIARHYGYDFSNYAQASLLRRINRFVHDTRCSSAYDLKFRLVNDEAFFRRLLEEITVNVTEMFRDPVYYRALREKVLPALASYPIIKIWHAGCSSGEEVFSMCILLHEAGLLKRSRIYATDVNPANLEKARKGILPLRYMKEYTANYLQSGGQQEFSDYYTAMYDHVILQHELRKQIVFSQHNLVSDGMFNEFQLVSCRNVMIYFNRRLQDRVTGLFHESLMPRGYLAIGLKESLDFSSFSDKFEEIQTGTKLYRRKE